MESLIPIVNQLQDICNTSKITLPIDLPQIVVVGAQSCGKSSVIESIVQRDFLPRGTGIVTRRPLVIRLFKVAENNSRHSDWAKFKHSDREYTDFEEVREEIELETERLCGNNKGICAEPIVLNVYSKQVVNLTLVDLPGLVLFPTGDQPEDIKMQIRELVIKYIENPNSIILAVSAANTDFVTSAAIELAGEVDPMGKRTLAVLTKLDLMEPDGDTLQVLSGDRNTKARLGIIGVINRTKQDILDKKPNEKVVEDEAAFLQLRYPTIAEKNGQPYLSKRLSQLLMRHIRDCLPDLKIRIESQISQCQAELKSYGQPVADKAKTILDLINKFSLSYCYAINSGKKQIKTTELTGDARIQYIFRKSFGRALTNINPLETLDSKVILTAALNDAGLDTAIRVQDVFKSLVTEQIGRLEDPSLRCVELVYEEMRQVVKHCGDEVHLELLRFPRLREKIEEILTQLLDDRLPVTRDIITNLVACCSEHIDTEDPRLRESYLVSNYPEPLRTNGDCDMTIRSIMPAQNGKSQNGSGGGGGSNAPSSVTMFMNDEFSLRHETELRECDAIAKRVQAYFNIVRDEIRVFVPRMVMRYMVNHVKSNLQSALGKEVYRAELFDTLLSESDDIARRRKETAEMLEALKKASDIINAIHYKKLQ